MKGEKGVLPLTVLFLQGFIVPVAMVRPCKDT